MTGESLQCNAMTRQHQQQQQQQQQQQNCKGGVVRSTTITYDDMDATTNIEEHHRKGHRVTR